MSQGPESEQERQAPTIRDRRRIDPETYQVREPQGQPAAPAAPGGPAGTDPSATTGGSTGEPVADERDARIDDLTRQVAERTDDLQRLQAEYVNYKRRVDRDRAAARTTTIGGLLGELLPVLDNIAAAREHDELVGGFKAVGEAVEKFATNHGLEAYGAVDDPFDPQIHEALMQLPDAGDGHPVCAQVFQVGYRVGDRVLRPARVAVGAAPAEQSDPSAPGSTGQVDNGADAGTE